MTGSLRPATQPEAGQAVAAARREASALLRSARLDGSFAASLPAARALAEAWPHEPHVAHVLGHIIEGGGDAGAARAHWRETVKRFPASAEAFAQFCRLEAARRGAPALRRSLDRMFPEPAALAEPRARLLAAIGAEAAGEPARAETLYRGLVHDPRDGHYALLRLAVLLEERGALNDAIALLGSAAAERHDRTLKREHDRLQRTVAALRGRYPGIPLDDQPLSLAVLETMLEEAVAARRADPPPAPGRTLGKLVLISGSLGGGGAERQLVATALGLQQASRKGEAIAGCRIAGPVAVLCRRLDSRHGHDFFLPRLAEAGIPVASYMAAPRFGGAPRHAVLGDAAYATRHLPMRVREGVERLTELLRLEAPEVVHIWQDGMIVAAGLAALLARVPRIVLNVRTLPPSTRTDRLRPEQRPLFRQLLRAPGVVLTANSALAARAYEDWLELPPGAVAVVPNGVAALDQAGTPADEERWRAFAQETAGGFTLGGVMRMDANKRPLDWLAVAEALAACRPDARFVLVGDGELAAAARAFAAERGIAARTLFVGRSAQVGYWLSRMDALLLTSRHEGTPNVLIEAQLAGLPVVTTPAGAAAETVVPGLTGFVLDDAETVDAAVAATLLDRIAGWSPTESATVAGIARHRALRRYAPAAMLHETVANFAAPSASPLIG